VSQKKLIQTKSSSLEFMAYKNQSKKSSEETLAEETPIAFVYNGISHVVMMASPNDLEDFALGFSITEEIINSPTDFYSVEINYINDGIELKIEISSECFAYLKEKRRNLTGRTGCGLCGAESLTQVIKYKKNKIISHEKFSHDQIRYALDQFSSNQILQKKTGATHATAICNNLGKILLIREDVGRHNAFDKLIGAAIKQRVSSKNSFVITSSRASYEMIQKLSYLNLRLIAAISAPTALAVRLADKIGITLIGFAREDRYTIYSHKERIIE
jgi:FdhD protein